MKRVLLIAHTFPPSPSAGAVRAAYLARYLPACGWDVRVAASSTSAQFADRTTVPRSKAAAFIDSLPFRLRDALLFPDASATWILPALFACEKILRTQTFDAILSTAHPPTVHVVGYLLARRTGLPWIADYRDAWTGNPYNTRAAWRRWAEALLERSMLRRANRITTISQPLSAVLNSVHGRDDVAVIPNAYDPAEWQRIDVRPDERFTLTFTGSLHDGKRPPDMLLQAIAELRAEGDPAGATCNVHLYGPNNEFVQPKAQAYGISSHVHVHGVVDREQAMRAQRRASSLLVLLSLDAATSTEMGSKYLEYVAARRPILAIGPRDSVMRAFIARYDLGWFASDVGELKAALRHAYARYRAGNADLPQNDSAASTAQQLAQRFASLLDDASCETTAAERVLTPDASLNV